MAVGEVMEKRDDVCYTKVIEHLLRRCKCSVLEIRLWDDGYGTMSKLHAIDSNSHSVDVWCNGKPVFLHKVGDVFSSYPCNRIGYSTVSNIFWPNIIAERFLSTIKHMDKEAFSYILCDELLSIAQEGRVWLSTGVELVHDKETLDELLVQMDLLDTGDYVETEMKLASI